jgi:hypothetical protein
VSTPDLGSWEPPSGILADYERLWIDTSDAPRVYHVAVGLSVLAATLETRCYLPFGGDRIYPNLWCIILGPSSFFRKSSCLAKGRKTLVRANPDALLPDEFSREALLKRLSTRGQGLLTYSEFSGALATFGRDYMSGTKELLTDLYDSPESYTRVVGPTEFKATNVCLPILAASQTGWFLEKLKGGDIRGGFLARFSFWPAFEKRRFLAFPPEPDITLFREVVRDLQLLAAESPRACSLGPGVEARYAKWLEKHERELHGHPRGDDLSPFWSRLSIMTLKFAMLLQASHDGATEITLDVLERALALTDFLKRALGYLFQDEFAFTREQQDRQKVLRKITNTPGVTYRDLMRACSLSKVEMDRVLATLGAEERIVREGKAFRLRDDSSAIVSATGTDVVHPTLMRVK